MLHQYPDQNMLPCTGFRNSQKHHVQGQNLFEKPIIIPHPGIFKCTVVLVWLEPDVSVSAQAAKAGSECRPIADSHSVFHIQNQPQFCRHTFTSRPHQSPCYGYRLFTVATHGPASLRKITNPKQLQNDGKREKHNFVSFVSPDSLKKYGFLSWAESLVKLGYLPSRSHGILINGSEHTNHCRRWWGASERSAVTHQH